MSKFKKYSTKTQTVHAAHSGEAVINFMGENSYVASPLTTLMMVAGSSIFGEPSYYRKSHDSPAQVTKYLSMLPWEYKSTAKNTTDLFTEIVNAALDYDFGATLALAVELRKVYNMRLNPSAILVLAAIHPKRAEFNKRNAGVMRLAGAKIIGRLDDIKNQFDIYCYLKGSKKGLPTILKKIWATALESAGPYTMKKYIGSGLIDLVRISHANSTLINELMQTGNIKVTEDQTTWETRRSAHESWKTIFSKTYIPHMALLRNLRGMFAETNDLAFAKKVMVQLKKGVGNGKQFPFRYWSALQAVKNGGAINHKGLITDTLEECMDSAIANFPLLAGKTISLCDNSGSAHGAFTSTYGTVKVSEIGNLSGLITGSRSDEGYVGVFGDRLDVMPVSKRNGLLSQLKEVNRIGQGIGHGTEHGFFTFFYNAIQKKEHWDNIFIYSDQQAGRGGLFGESSAEGYDQYLWKVGGHIDLFAMLLDYRKRVNPKVNVFSVQTAGYDNNAFPENTYRTSLLTGWTGKEALFAQNYIRMWDTAEQGQQ